MPKQKTCFIISTLKILILFFFLSFTFWWMGFRYALIDRVSLMKTTRWHNILQPTENKQLKEKRQEVANTFYALTTIKVTAKYCKTSDKQNKMYEDDDDVWKTSKTLYTHAVFNGGSHLYSLGHAKKYRKPIRKANQESATTENQHFAEPVWNNHVPLLCRWQNLSSRYA